ncbi:MAG: glycosyltransferase family 2 protein [Bacteroidales bacterium]|nr:glycosyltransferase family 2 protein [Bacteroidales bacterium]
MDKKILIAIPAFNEEKKISTVLEKIYDFRDQTIIVDDGSLDSTPDLIKKLGFTLITHKTNSGLTKAYKTIYKYANKHNYTHIIYLDSDGQHDSAFINEFIEKLEHYDFVIGNRFHNVNDIPKMKIASNLFASLLFKKISGITLPDVACGFRGLKTSICFSGFNLSSFDIIYEILFRHILLKIKIGYVNIPCIYPKNIKLSTNIKEIISLIKAAQQYSIMPELEYILGQVAKKEDFSVNFFDFDFNAKFLYPASYIFQTDYEKAKRFYKSRLNVNYGIS